MVLTLDKVIQGIEPLKDEWRKKARSHIDNLTMPRGSLGEVLVIAERLAAIKETLKPSVNRKAIVTMAGDHGVVEEGVSAYPQEVTPQMVANFVGRGSGYKRAGFGSRCQGYSSRYGGGPGSRRTRAAGGDPFVQGRLRD